MTKDPTFVDILRRRALQTPERVVYSFLSDGINVSETLTYRDLDLLASKAAAIIRKKTNPRDRVLLIYPPGLKFIEAFFGCLYADVISVPIAPPHRNRYDQRFKAILDDAQPTCILATERIISGMVKHNTTSIYILEHSQLFSEQENPYVDIIRKEDDTALLQYTSGSTSSPKGVMVTHKNLMANSKEIRNAFGLHEGSISVSWLPHFHDMGLIDGILQPLFTGYSTYLLSANTFLQTPVKWLKAISKYRADHSGGPDFAYAHCTRKVMLKDCLDLDLSCWLSAYNGAEPIKRETLEYFAERFNPYGFSKKSFFPCYGLAENTLMVSGAFLDQESMYFNADRQYLKQNQIVPASISGDNSVGLVSSGYVHGHKIELVTPENCTRTNEDQVGEIWVAGSSVTKGYWKNEEATSDTYGGYIANTGEGPFLRTGDLGFIHNGALFLTGRLKDILIVRGRNYYPNDIEETVKDCTVELVGGKTVAFQISDMDIEKLVIGVELSRAYIRSYQIERIARVVREKVSETHGLQVHILVLLKPNSIPKTTSGKIQRLKCRKQYMSGNLGELDSSILYSTLDSQDLNPIDIKNLDQLNGQERDQKLRSYFIWKLTSITGQLITERDFCKSFISLGIDSLRAFELAHSLEQNLNVSVSFTDLLGDNSVEGLITVLSKSFNKPNLKTVYTELEYQSPSKAFNCPASYGQSSLWFMQHLAPDDSVYNESVAIRINGRLNIDQLKQSIYKTIEQHDTLRTVFDGYEGSIYQVLQTSLSSQVYYNDMSQNDKDDINNVLMKMKMMPFDLRKGPLFKVFIYKTAAEEYVLLLVAHHIIIDLKSAEIFFEDMWNNYRALKLNSPVKALNRRAQNSNFSNWQSLYLKSSNANKALNYWQEKLAEAKPLLLPLSKTRKPSTGFSGKQINYNISAYCKCQLVEIAKEQHVTLFVLLLGIYKILLHRYTGKDDILIGSTVSGRSHPQFKRTIGYLVNQLVFRSLFEQGQSVLDFIQKLNNSVIEGLRYRDYPFSLLVKKLKIKEERGFSPLFQTMFNLQTSSLDNVVNPLALGIDDSMVSIDNLMLSPISLKRETSQFNLSLNCVEHTSGIRCTWEYNTELFETNDIEQLALGFHKLLEYFVKNPDTLISQMPLMNMREQHNILHSGALVLNDIVAEENINALFERQVIKTPNATAVASTAGSLTYHQLNSQANKLTHALLKFGVKHEEPVGIYLSRSPEMIIAILGILKTGAAYVPLDPSLPTKRIQYMVLDSGIKFVITDTKDQTLPVKELDNIHLIELKSEVVHGQPEHNVTVNSIPESLAYIIYTSGSTGQPKGVMINHKNLNNYLHHCKENYHKVGGSGAVVSSSFGFDASVTSILSPLIVGTTVFLASEENEIDSVIELMQSDLDLTLIKLTPAQLRLITLRLEQRPKHHNSSVRVLVVGGDILSVDDLKFWQSYCPRLQIVNEYGPTETTVGVTTHNITKESLLEETVPIGRPISNANLYVLDQYMQPVPPGVEAELYIGGASVARSYHNRPEQTKERFVQNPFTKKEIIYKTGDLVKYRRNGILDIIGRSDKQIKIRGFRVEPAEVENTINKHPEVLDVVVDSLLTHQNHRILIAFIRLINRDKKDMSAIFRAFLLDKLPGYMIPSKYIEVEKFPLTINGKVDRLALKNRVTDSYTDKGYTCSFNNSIESTLAEIWADILQHNNFRKTDNFFDLGGDSVLTVMVQNRLEKVLGIKIPVTDLFQYTTLTDLASHLSQLDNGKIDVSNIAKRKKLRNKALLARKRVAKKHTRE